MYKKTDIAIDADGVIFDFLGAFVEIASETTQREIVEISPEWNLPLRYGMTESEVSDVLHIFNTHGLWSSIPILDNADKALGKLVDSGFSICIVSAIPVNQANSRKKALSRIGVDLPVVAVGAGSSKKNAYQKLKPHFVVDDFAKHISEAKEVGISERLLINSCLHQQDTSNATAQFNSLESALPYLLNKGENLERTA